jgi:hypothetical protein
VRQSAVSMTAESVTFRTTAKRKALDEYIETAERIAADVDRKTRDQQALCPHCFYFMRGSIAGNAFCYRPCGLCGVELVHHNTNSDTVCTSCAKKHSLCRHCGSDSNLRTKRRKFDWIKRKVGRKRG